MLAAAARLRALPSLTASCTRQPRWLWSGKLRIEMEEDAEAEARSLASLAVEQPALFRAVTGADNGKLPDLRGLCFGTDSLVGEGSNRVSDQVAQSSTVDRSDGPYSGSERSEDEQFDSSVEQVRSSYFPFSSSALQLCPIGGASPAAPVPRGLAWLRSAWPAIVERWLLLGPRRRGEDNFSLLSRNRVTDSIEDLLFSVEDPVGFLSSTVDRSDGPYSGSERSEDEQFDSSVEQVRSSYFPFSSSALQLCPIGGASPAAPVPRGLAWLRSAWPAIVERWLLLGPRRRGEDDFSLLSRLGYYHDDRYGDDCYGWVCSGDVGWPADYLGGRIFQPLSSSQLDAAWAHRMWRHALQRVQATLMGPSGSAWLALRSAERRRHEAFCLLLRERRISRIHARSLSPGMNRERDQPLADAEAAYLRAARHAEECRHRCRRARALAAPTSGRRRHHRHHHRACG